MLRGLEPLASPSLTAAEEHNVKLGMTKPRREGITNANATCVKVQRMQIAKCTEHMRQVICAKVKD